MGFQAATARWFAGRFGEPTAPQRGAWPAIAAGRHTLIAAPTGSGKTLAAFLAAIDALVERAQDGPLPDETSVVYVSPLKALSNDIRRNLEEPLAGIEAELERSGGRPAGIRAAVRTGDTPSSARSAMTRRPPHILVTTPESLYILLTSRGGRGLLRTARSVIVDEIHAVAGDKRGAHLALTLERLDALVRADGGRLTRIGLSATQRPIDEMARFLVGARSVAPDGTPDCEIVDTGHRRDLDLCIEVPRSPLEAVMSNEVWGEVYDRVADLAREHRTTLVFVNTRRLAERAAMHLAERLGTDAVGAHHGSMARDRRLEAERRLKNGEYRLLVATASLELGIDIGDVDLVCTLGQVRSIATLLQRVGRSGHAVGRTPRGRVFPTSRDELVDAAAALRALRAGDLERLRVRDAPLDILSQQLVAECACRDLLEDEAFDLVRAAWPYRGLTRAAFDEVTTMIAAGFETRRGRRGALVHLDPVTGRLSGRRGARLAALTSGGAIPDNATYHVVLEPENVPVGTVDEDFAVESLPGDVFQLGSAAWKIRRIEQGRVVVEDAAGQPPNIPFWFGESPGRSDELSRAVARMRTEVDAALGDSSATALGLLRAEYGLDDAAARQLVEYLAAARACLGVLPNQQTIVVERFFDEAGDQHVVIHAPFGSRMNRAWGLALRKRFCRTFNFELQAAATEDAIVLSLGPTHSFPLEDVFGFLGQTTVREVLTQALLDAPMFGIRWRWNASRALALLRWRGGRRVPPRLQRMQAEDLIAVVFPDQLACLENIGGDREIPDHPLVRETIRDCLVEAMDIERLEALLGDLEAGRLRLEAHELREPSPLAHEILTARPYAFLDDAPLEERRTQAVQLRRWIDPETAADLGRLDAAAIERVRDEVRPAPRNADELYDALVVAGALTADELAALPDGPGLAAELAAGGRATAVTAGPARLSVAVERLPQVRAVHPAAPATPDIAIPARVARDWDADDALLELVRARLGLVGPTTAARLAAELGVASVAIPLGALEGEGVAMRGRFTPGADHEEWCDRRLLARIHRATLVRLRREIEPVAPADYVRFLFDWQRAAPAERARGAESLAPLVERLEGFAAPAAAWESELLPARLDEYDPDWLDALCLAGRVVWCRGRPGPAGSARPVRTTPLVLVRRGERATWGDGIGDDALAALSTEARHAHDHLANSGASFFDEIRTGTGLLHTQLETALAELVAAGAVTSDGFVGLRALLTPQDRRPRRDARARRGAPSPFGIENAGRWSLLPAPESLDPQTRAARAVPALLRRWGVVLRAVLERDALAPPWRDLLPELRRLEARGEVRGGRFVSGFSGEQFATTDAVATLRAVRRSDRDGELVSVSGADPLNLCGILTPGPRVAAIAANRVLWRDGVPLAALEAGEVRWLADVPESERWGLRNALQRRRVPDGLRAWFGRSA